MLIVLKNNSRGVVYNCFEADEEKKKIAIDNYNTLQKNIEAVFYKHEDKNKKNEFYWEVGEAISSFIDSFGVLPDRYKADFIEASNYIFNVLSPSFIKTDLKRRRNTALTFYLFSKFPKSLALGTSWSFWAYYFQLPYFREMH